MSTFSYRLAELRDIDALKALMGRAIENLQGAFLSPEQVRASHSVMGLDTQLVRDQTYFIVESAGRVAGCGGWSWRETLYGGDDSIVVREARRLDPATDAARVRAMYTDPAFARQGVGRLIVSICEAAACAHGFTRVEMMATLAGEPLYRACGYIPIERIESAAIGGVNVPLVRMGKSLSNHLDHGSPQVPSAPRLQGGDGGAHPNPIVIDSGRSLRPTGGSGAVGRRRTVRPPDGR
jgi:GNAT superfamily N-acetyltransferase